MEIVISRLQRTAESEAVHVELLCIFNRHLPVAFINILVSKRISVADTGINTFILTMFGKEYTIWSRISIGDIFSVITFLLYKGKKMRKKIFVLLLLLLTAVFSWAAAADYSGIWCMDSYKDEEGVHQPVMPLLSYVPVIELREDQTAKLTFGSDEIEGRWEVSETGRIGIFTDVIQDIYLLPEGEQLVTDPAYYGTDGGSSVYVKLDPHTTVGKWQYQAASNEKGNNWFLNSDRDIMELYEDGTASRYSLMDGKKYHESSGSWKREGNEIVFLLNALDSEGNGITVPYLYFRMKDGFLINDVQEDGQEKMLWLYGNMADVQVETDISDLSAFLDTTWTLYGADANGILIPGHILKSGNGTIIDILPDGRTDIIVSDKVIVSSQLKLEDGGIRFIFEGKAKKQLDWIACLTEEGYLKVTENGMIDYYRLDDESGRRNELTATGNTVWDLSVGEKNNTGTAYGGNKLTFTAKFNDSSVVNKKKKNNGITWSVTDADGNSVDGLKIDKNGVLTISREIDKSVRARVTAASVYYGTKDSYDLMIRPKIKEIITEPEKLKLYIGQTAELQVSVSPADIPTDGLTVSFAKSGIADIQETESGKYTVSGLKKGKTTISLKGPGGVAAKVAVTVEQPVTDLTLGIKKGQKAAAGKKINLTAAVTPKSASDKSLTWEVDENCRELAKISEKGTLTISGDAVPGSVIIVYCTAEGAPEPIRKSIEIQVQ